VPINQDFSLALYGGTDSTALALIHAFTGSAIVEVNFAGPEAFIDLSGATHSVPIDNHRQHDGILPD